MNKKALTVGLISAFLVISMTSMAVAQDDPEESSDTTVEVSSDVALDVRPTDLSYTGVEPGSVSAVSDQDFTAIELENIGSEDIGQISAETTMPSAEPFATGEALSYDSGNFIQFSTDTVSDQDRLTEIREVRDFHYANRVDYHEDPEPSYIQNLEGEDINDALATDFNEPEASVGRFRSGEQEYFYVVYFDAGESRCNGAGTTGDSELWVGTDAHDPTTLGTFDFTDDEVDDIEAAPISDLEESDEYGIVTNIDLGAESYNALTYCDGTVDTGDQGHVVRPKINVEVENPETGTVTGEILDGTQDYLLDVSTEDNSLRPGQSFPLDLRVQVPLGVAQGQVEVGTLTVLASELQ